MSDDPVPLEGSIAWRAQLSLPVSANVGMKLQPTGSAWIDKAPQSILFGFKKYVLSYQKTGDSGWKKIADTICTEMRNDVLGEWNTAGLTPGSYSVRLTLVSDTPDEFAVDAVRSMTLLPPVSDVASVPSPKDGTLYPNPAIDLVHIKGVKGKTVIYDVMGLERWIGSITYDDAIDVSRLERGWYVVKIGEVSFTMLKK